ncbi:MAG: insulinase family protein [Geobacter sp.]|nr:MAG: insulinase family protein [Geobacter sp.]
MIIPTFSPFSSSEVEELPHALLASQVTEKKLKNGLTVLVKEVYPASVVCISVWTGIGSVYENDHICGISHFIEHMLFKGTETRPVGKIAQEIHSLGGYINGFTSYACTCYWIVLPSRYFSTATDIMADALIHPLFNPEEIKKEREVIIEEIKMYQDRPESFCFERLMGLAYKNHRARRPITGYEEVVAKLSTRELIEFYRNYYVPDNMAIVVVGDVKIKRALKVMEESFGFMESGENTKDLSPDEPPQDGARSAQYRGDIGTSYFYTGFHVGGITSPDMCACDLLASILGEGRSSRLHQGLREKKALVTSIDASILALKDTGLFIIEAVMNEKNIEDSRIEVGKEILRIQADGVLPHELKKAKNMVESSYIFSQETVEGLCRKLGYYEMIGDFTLVDQYVRGLYAVTEEEVKAAARKYLVEQNRSEVVYLPGG